MTGDDVRALVKSDPFRAFVIHYRTGQKWTVRSPEDIWVPPKPNAMRIYVADVKGLFDIIDASWITEITFKPNGRTKRRRKAG